MKDIGAIRERGYAGSRDELIQGAVAIAAPFLDGAGQVLGSLGLFGPGVRMTDAVVDRHGRMLAAEARQLSAALGWHGPPFGR